MFSSLADSHISYFISIWGRHDCMCETLNSSVSCRLSSELNRLVCILYTIYHLVNTFWWIHVLSMWCLDYVLVQIYQHLTDDRTIYLLVGLLFKLTDTRMSCSHYRKARHHRVVSQKIIVLLTDNVVIVWVRVLLYETRTIFWFCVRISNY